MPLAPTTRANQAYWNQQIHDASITSRPAGTPGFFKDLEAYRYEKLAYLPELVNFAGYRSKRILEIGCGTGLDLARFTRGGSHVSSVDLAPASIELTRSYFFTENLTGNFSVMDGERLGFPDDLFDLVYAFGVIQYTSNPHHMIQEIHRVMRVGGEGILMVYNRYSWMNLLAKLMKVKFENEDAPAFHLFSVEEFKELLVPFPRVEIIPERFPVKTRLQHGIKAALYNKIFVGLFNFLPRSWVRKSGWHLVAFVKK